jgi:hypothetical protein
MSVLVTKRVKVHNFDGTKQAVEKYGDAMKKAGCHWRKAHQPDGVGAVWKSSLKQY